VFAALAASRWIEAQTGWSIKKFIRTARRHRTIEIQAGPRLINAADPLPDDLREALTKINAGNPGIGRPANVEIIFNRHIRRDTPGVFRTAIDRPKIGPDTGGVVLNLFYKHSRVKQYLKDGKAMRIETVINPPATCSRRQAFTQFPKVPSWIPRSRATSAIGLPVSITICTASALNCGLNLRRCSGMDRSSQSSRESLSKIFNTPHPH
jgi:hypothetical protein